MYNTNIPKLSPPLITSRTTHCTCRSVDDIDAWSGAVSEHSLPGAMVGPLNACIIGRQFRSLKRGDRFWYEYQQPSVGFTTGKFNQMSVCTMGRHAGAYLRVPTTLLVRC